MKKLFSFRQLDKDEQFDPLDLHDCVPFTQADFYGEWQRSAGREVKRFVIEEDGVPIVFAQAIKFTLPFAKSYYYVPYGPVVKGECTDELMKCLRAGLRRECQNSVFVRLDFTPSCEGASEFFRPAPESTIHGGFFQPRVEWGTELNDSEEMFSRLDKSTRYSINLAGKEGVEVNVYDSDLMAHFDDFYSLMSETSERNEFSLHSREYYELVFKDCEKRGNAVLFIAQRSGKAIGTAFIILYGKSAHYAYAATHSDERHSQPSYAVVWRAIREARERGAEVFNFGGIANDKYTRLRWEGLTKFKKKFNGTKIIHSELHDLVLSEFWYRIYTLKKKLFK